jgi:hypothetical protein
MEKQKEKIPLFKSWKGWYILVLAVLLALVLFFEWITKTYA